MTTYVIALRRGVQPCDATPEEQVRQVPGVQVKGSANPSRIVVESSPQAAAEITRRFGERLIVEPEILHHH